MLTNPEIEKITSDYFLADDHKAVDIYFETSFLLEYLMRQQKGIFKRPAGGERIKVHLKYDGAEAGFYSRNETLSEDERENITACFFAWKHAFGNATLYRADELQNASVYAEVDNVLNKIETAQESCRDMLANNLFNAAGDDSKLITGLGSLTSESADVAYGTLTENGLVAADGKKPWEGKTNSTSANISPTVIRTLRSDAKIRGGKKGKPDLGVTSETLYNKLAGILEVQQRFTAADAMAKAGFTGLSLDGMMIGADDFVGDADFFALNSMHIGFAIHKKGYFARTKWNPLTSGAQGRTMKILWDGNMVCNNRKAHKRHSALT